MDIKQLYNDNLRKLPNEYVSVMICENIKVFRSSNFHVTTGINFTFVDEPGFVSMCEYWRNTHTKTIAQKSFI